LPLVSEVDSAGSKDGKNMHVQRKTERPLTVGNGRAAVDYQRVYGSSNQSNPAKAKKSVAALMTTSRKIRFLSEASNQVTVCASLFFSVARMSRIRFRDGSVKGSLKILSDFISGVPVQRKPAVGGGSHALDLSDGGTA